jgi:hypothetical protein
MRFTYVGEAELRIATPEYDLRGRHVGAPRIVGPTVAADVVLYPNDAITVAADSPMLPLLRAHSQWFREASP